MEGEESRQIYFPTFFFFFSPGETSGLCKVICWGFSLLFGSNKNLCIQTLCTSHLQYLPQGQTLHNLEFCFYEVHSSFLVVLSFFFFFLPSSRKEGCSLACGFVLFLFFFLSSSWEMRCDKQNGRDIGALMRPWLLIRSSWKSGARKKLSSKVELQVRHLSKDSIFLYGRFARGRDTCGLSLVASVPASPRCVQFRAT